MIDRVKIIEDILKVNLPEDYKNFIKNIGLISDERGEIYGYIEGMNINKIPSIIAATKLYKKNYQSLLPEDIVISFDEFQNSPVILNTLNGKIYFIEKTRKVEKFPSFSDWFKYTFNKVKD